ncbi:MAG: hypothetical protein QNK23_15270 [Crocinitomicaceae bacterium]|nr:hypothetical protein [Crocinitomicaceae bacterium]
MEEFINNEYFHLALSILCLVWGVKNLKKNGSDKKHSTTFLSMDKGYSYLLIAFGGVLIVWSMINIIGLAQ